MQSVGFFRELREGFEDGPSIRDAANRLAPSTARAAAEYLRGGTTYVAARLALRDFFGSGKASGTHKVLTDGVWQWPQTLAFYVENYLVDLPTEFIGHMERNGWSCPKLSAEDLSALRKRSR